MKSPSPRWDTGDTVDLALLLASRRHIYYSMSLTTTDCDWNSWIGTFSLSVCPSSVLLDCSQASVVLWINSHRSVFSVRVCWSDPLFHSSLVCSTAVCTQTHIDGERREGGVSMCQALQNCRAQSGTETTEYSCVSTYQRVHPVMSDMQGQCFVFLFPPWNTLSD